METIYIIALSLYFFYCVITGYISAGKGSKSDSLTAIFGGIALIAGIAGIVFACINKQWAYIGVIILLYIIGLKIGGAIMRKHLSKSYYNLYTANENAPVQEMPHNSSIQMSKAELIRHSNIKSSIMKQIEKMDKDALNMTKEQMHDRLFESEEKQEKRVNTENQLYSDLYDCMFEMPGFHDILEQHHATPEMLKALENRIKLIGYPDMKGYYIPVALISLGKPLNFILSNKEDILHSDIYTIQKITNQAIQLL